MSLALILQEPPMLIPPMLPIPPAAVELAIGAIAVPVGDMPDMAALAELITMEP